ncbi:hypothetical protein [Bifidobacterium subtile]|jgi:hypothetical protein|uniref:hypothetical protein n=1 Tax=Bifidobacterium subtile TaxID=77635 RepID=UPI00126A0B41|nr:hypothetical protein [Bifidobacterium subtile]QOL36543.1 hypothetical protein BS3272_00545 [Bifidobacterium subtile]
MAYATSTAQHHRYVIAAAIAIVTTLHALQHFHQTIVTTRHIATIEFTKRGNHDRYANSTSTIHRNQKTKGIQRRIRHNSQHRTQ